MSSISTPYSDTMRHAANPKQDCSLMQWLREQKTICLAFTAPTTRYYSQHSTASGAESGA